MEACRSIVAQNFESCEICISDDCSTDGRERELLEFLEASPMAFAYRRLTSNRRYDANLREAISLSQGEYCFLLGNDDGLATRDTLAELFEDIKKFAPVSVAITNYRDSGSPHLFRRVRTTGIAGSGPATAARVFRHFSFVSGIVLHGPTARHMATGRWDGSEMYQMFLGCSMIAAGGNLLTVDRVCIDKDLQVAGESVDSYARRPVSNRAQSANTTCRWERFCLWSPMQLRRLVRNAAPAKHLRHRQTTILVYLRLLVGGFSPRAILALCGRRISRT